MQRSYNASAVRVVPTTSLRRGRQDEHERTPSDPFSRPPLLQGLSRKSVTTDLHAVSDFSRDGNIEDGKDDKGPQTAGGLVRRRKASTEFPNPREREFTTLDTSGGGGWKGLFGERPSVVGGGGRKRKPAMAMVVPADEASDQTSPLCVEMRIRLYEHGAMSKLLEELADVSVLVAKIRVRWTVKRPQRMYPRTG